MTTILDIRGLSVDLFVEDARRSIVRRMDLKVTEGEIVGLVGESGCGKSITAGALTGLLPTSGDIRFDRYELAGVDIANDSRSLERLRGKGIAMIFQEPTSHLDPLQRVGDQLLETLRAHRIIGEDAGHQTTCDLLDSVGLAPGAILGRRYPHELSGGMNQRVMIALALACAPKLLIADEPTTALDDHHRRAVSDILRRQFLKDGKGVLWISHDLSLLCRVADRLLIMQQGHIIEEGSVAEILAAPRQPFTQALINAMPERLC
jgi:ABC-type dipeptide/oligopeptide/nickel transport system ATPase component